MTWASALLAVYGGYLLAGIGGLLSALGALAVSFVWRNQQAIGLRRTVTVVLLFMTAGCAAFGVRAYTVDSHPLRDAAARSMAVEIRFVPTADPRLLQTSKGREPRFLLRGTLRAYRLAGEGGWLTSRAGVTVFATGAQWQGTTPGETVSFRGELAIPTRRDFTVASIFTRDDPVTEQEASWLQRRATGVRTSYGDIVTETLREDQAQLLPGLVIGDRSAMPPEMRDEFIATSLTHLTVVSGTHVTIVCGAVLLFTRYTTGSGKAAAVITAVALVWFVVVCRPEPSVLRAAAMGSVTLLALISGRRRQALPALNAAVIVLLLVRPQLATDMGFALSVTATAGIVVAAPVLTDALMRRGLPKPVAPILAVAVVAHFVTAPLIAAFAGNFSVVGVLANLLVAPVVTAAIVTGYAGLVLAPVWEGAAAAAVYISGFPVAWLLVVARYCAQLPYAMISVPSGLYGAMVMAAATGLLGVAVFTARVRRFVVAGAAGCLLVLLPLWLLGPRFPPDDWIVAACDVGQGDSFVLASGPGSAIVVDAGPEPELVNRCLRRLGVKQVDLVIMTHMHADHVAGLPGVLRGRTVQAVGVGRGRDPDFGWQLVREAAASARVPLVELTEGTVLEFPQFTVSVLGPPTSRAPYLDPNDQSVVVMAAARATPWPGFRVLFTGDVEAEGQQWLLETYSDAELAADVFTVPHHGAGTSLPEFLDAIRAGAALIGVGAENSYGHPHTDVISHLTDAGVVIARADMHGTVSVVHRDGTLAVVGERAGAPW